MPEGPEVYVMTQKLKKFIEENGMILHKIIPIKERYIIGKNKFPIEFINDMPQKVSKIISKGKKTIIYLEKWTLIFSYGMTGHWQKNKNKFAQVGFIFGDKEYYWISSRSLPTCVIQVYNDSKTVEKELSKLGLDIINDTPNDEQILKKFCSKKNICAFLMEQSNFSGIGNYIKSVILYRCKISPFNNVSSLSDQQKLLIWKTAQKVAQEAINAEGMGIRNYLDEDGKLVGINFDITPYNCDKDNFGNKVERVMIAGRATWWVPKIQG